MEAEEALETLAEWRQKDSAFYSSTFDLCVSKIYQTVVSFRNKIHDLTRVGQI